jgi:isopentenyl-diphosphate delta-isomerase
VPVVAKETGSGISSSVARRLHEVGVRHVDVSGAGGTSWVAVEMHRAEGRARALGQTFRDWGIPTAASVAWVSRHGFETIFATGGVRDGLTIAKAIALGATVGGIARSALQVVEESVDAAREFFERVEAELRTAMLLVGARDLSALRATPRIVTGELGAWLALP